METDTTTAVTTVNADETCEMDRTDSKWAIAVGMQLYRLVWHRME